MKGGAAVKKGDVATGARGRRAPGSRKNARDSSAVTSARSSGARKRRRRRDKSESLGQRLSRISPRMVILAILAIFFMAFAFSPTTRNLKATAGLKEKEAELKKEESSTAELERQVSEARSLTYVEKEARRQRMVLPGEILYLVTPEDSGSRLHYRVKSLQSLDEAWERIRVMLNCAHQRHEEGY